MSFATYTIGRASTNDIVVSDTSVSREHAEMTVIANSSRVFLIDRASSHGLFRLNGDEWSNCSQGFWYKNERLKIGDYVTSIEVLLNAVTHQVLNESVVPYEAVSLRPSRNLETGEVKD